MFPKADDKKCVLKLAVDDEEHEVTVTKAGVQYKDEKVASANWQKLEVVGEGQNLRVHLDNWQVIPKPNYKFSKPPTIAGNGTPVFSVSHIEGLMQFTVQGRIMNGKAQITLLSILSPTDQVQITSWEKLPEKHRAMIQTVLQLVEKGK